LIDSSNSGAKWETPARGRCNPKEKENRIGNKFEEKLAYTWFNAESGDPYSFLYKTANDRASTTRNTRETGEKLPPCSHEARKRSIRVLGWQEQEEKNAFSRLETDNAKEREACCQYSLTGLLRNIINSSSPIFGRLDDYTRTASRR